MRPIDQELDVGWAAAAARKPGPDFESRGGNLGMKLSRYLASVRAGLPTIGNIIVGRHVSSPRGYRWKIAIC